MGVNGQVRLLALTPFVPLSRGAGEGERAAPLSHAVGEGLGVRAKKACLFPKQRTQVLYPYQVCPPLPQAGEGEYVGATGPSSYTAMRPYALPRSGRGAGGEGKRSNKTP